MNKNVIPETEADNLVLNSENESADDESSGILVFLIKFPQLN
jgi:hypothetical protein